MVMEHASRVRWAGLRDHHDVPWRRRRPTRTARRPAVGAVVAGSARADRPGCARWIGRRPSIAAARPRIDSTPSYLDTREGLMYVVCRPLEVRGEASRGGNSVKTTMNTPRMMPGQEPYPPAELDTLHAVVHDAAAGDPGETNEPP